MDNVTIALRQIIDNLGDPRLAALAAEYDDKFEATWSEAREHGWQLRASAAIEEVTHGIRREPQDQG